ncbi:hypothetical protein VTK73DRAFT_6389 [Phialemonium thermophilum]|uniref:Defect at low temperature protein 1 n=1 Tax=Phialemonium thermophilum TaxID=223376 RepID=A0ABR3XVF9_9PEZI
MSPAASLAFRIVYKSLYLFLNLILLLLLLVIPADVIHQSVVHDERYNILVIALCYIVTILIVAFIYATRLYINRSIIASIPKAWLPIDRGDINKDVQKMIATALSRSAAIAYEARPRVTPILLEQSVAEEDERPPTDQLQHAEKKHSGIFGLKKTVTVEDDMGISLPPLKPVWGTIEHPGWSSPLSPDLPNLQYTSVISELPDLIEARALTLAPPEAGQQDRPTVLDPEAVSLLQRPICMGLREYLAHLSELNVLDDTPSVSDFISLYEFSRYSTNPLSNVQFRDLMRLFAEILRAMRPLNPSVLDKLDDSDDFGTPSFTDSENRIPRSSLWPNPQARHGRQDRLSRFASSSSATSHSFTEPGTRMLPPRNSSANTWKQYRTAPTTPKSRHAGLSPSSSIGSFAQTRHPYPVSQAASLTSSSSSTRSLASDGSGSVIRLSVTGDSTELPYVLRLTNSV